VDRLVLIGFMGSGKSTLGALAAREVGVDFVDLDACIEARTGKSVARIFATEGEPAFRRHELDALRQLDPPAGAIIATGGGIVETAAALPLMRALGRIVWLTADPDASVRRVGASAAVRPLLAGDWRSRWSGRAPAYAEWADAWVSTYPEPVEASLAALLALWRAGSSTG